MVAVRDAMKPDRQFPNAGFALLLTAVFVALQMALALPLELIATIYGKVTHQPSLHPAQNPLVLGAINLLAFGGVLRLGLYLAKTSPREIFALRPVRGILLLPILLSTAGAAVVLSEVDNLFRWIFPMPQFLVEFARNLFAMEKGWWGPMFVLVVVAPITEEVLFRGLILRGLLSRHDVRLAIVISAALFALAHLNPWQAASASSLGVLFGWWYYRTGSTVPGLIGHALVNGTVLTCGFLPLEIPGFNKGEPHTQVEFQPLWFDATGLVLIALGLWLFHRWSPRPEKPPCRAYDGPTPPVIPPSFAEPSN